MLNATIIPRKVSQVLSLAFIFVLLKHEQKLGVRIFAPTQNIIIYTLIYLAFGYKNLLVLIYLFCFLFILQEMISIPELVGLNGGNQRKRNLHSKSCIFYMVAHFCTAMHFFTRLCISINQQPQSPYRVTRLCVPARRL